MKIRDKKGFTLIEILIALALMSIITTAIYQLYISNYKTWVSQDLVIEMQQNARFAVDTMNRETQLMGYGLSGLPSIYQVAVTKANASEIEFRSKDESITSGDQRRQVSFRLVGTELKMGVSAWDGATFPVAAEHVLAESVTGLEFKYYNDQGTDVTGIPDQARRIKVTLKLQTSKKDPVTGDYKKMTLVAEIRPRNLGIGEVRTDITPPAVPTGLQVVDPGKCGKLLARWTPNTETDLAGYTIYYGQCSPQSTPLTCKGYTGSVKVPISAAAGYELSGLSVSPSNANGNTIPYVTYYVAVAANDASGNVSGYSAEVSGNPATSTRAFGGANDTTINIEKPTSIPTAFIGADGPSDGQVRLTWTPSTDSNVIGYRVYRKTDDSDYSAFPIVAGGSAIVQVANESALTSAANSFTDTGPGLIGCKVYYYAIEPVTCDATLIADDTGSDPVSKKYVSADYARTYGDGPGGGPDLPASPASDTAPADHTKPGTPVISKRADGTIVSGYKRAYLTVTNPADTDFDHTRIYYSTTGTPTVDELLGSPTYGVVSGGNPVPDSNVVGKGIKGRLEGANQTISFVHDSETTAAIEDVTAMHAPALLSPQYYYLAVAYDRCGNPKADTAAATTLATLCGDGTVGSPEYGPPDAPTGAAVSGCSTSMTITWNPITSTALVNPDAAGYRIYRQPTASFDTTLDPSILDVTPCSVNPNAACYLGLVSIGSPTTFTDSYGLTEGNVYSYGIVSTDCVYENRWIGMVDAAYRYNNSRYPKASGTPQGWLTYNGVKPGKIKREDQHREALTRDSAGDPADLANPIDGAKVFPTRGNHNIVKLYFRNTGQGTMTINAVNNIQWSKTTARLAKVSIGGAEYTPCPIIYGTTPTPPVVWAAPGIPGPASPTSIPLTGGVKIGASCPSVPILLEFRDSSGAASDLADMRGDNVRLTLNVQNDSTNTTSCRSYLTVTELDQAIPVDKGLTFDVDIIPDGKDNLTLPGPTDPTIVPPSGYTGAYVEMPKSLPIQVSANVKSNDIPAKTIRSATLYYNVTSRGITTPPSAGYTPLSMAWVSGYLYQASIPASRDKRVWFYVVAIDDHDNSDLTTGDRNFDRSPEVQSGYYAYDQTDDPCDYRPNNPTGLTVTNAALGKVDAATVNLQWTAPTDSVDALGNPVVGTSPILDLAGFQIYESVNAGAFAQIVGVSGTTSGGIYTYSRPAASFAEGTTLAYYVKAVDKCTPSPKVSDASATVTATKITRPSAPSWNTTYLCKASNPAPLTGISDRRVNIPGTNTDGSALTDAATLKVYYCSAGLLCNGVGDPQLIDTKTLPVAAGPYTYDFNIIAPYVCGNFFKVTVVDSSGNESGYSSAW